MSRASDTFHQRVHAAMARMTQDMHAGAATDDVDADFLAMMIPHHVGAVEMARELLQHGRDPATRQLAQDIIAGQTVEIESMQRRLAQLRRGERGAGEYPALGGTRGPS